MNLGGNFDSTGMVEVQQQLDTSTFELAYEKALLHTKIIYCAEETRQCRTQMILLQCENDELHNKVAQSDNRFKELELQGKQLKARLDETVNHLEKARFDVRTKSRDNEMLTAEISSLQSVTNDSTRLLTEKLALVRELSSLKPEIDHLRSQAIAHQSLLSEKLALQRQLSTIEVELENEKRSAQRAHAKEGRLQAEDARLELRIETLQADLMKERRQREKNERDAQKAQTEWENRRTTLESRLDAFRNKLRVTKEQLREAQMELKNSQIKNYSLSINHTKNDGLEISRKRAAAPIEDNSTIGTPGNALPTKLSNKIKTLPGDKSTFSITPFLNRASSVAPENSKELDGKELNEDMRASLDPLDDQREQIVEMSPVKTSTNGVFKTVEETMQTRKPGYNKNMQTAKITSKPFSAGNHKIMASLEKVNESTEKVENIEPDFLQRDKDHTLNASSIVSTEVPNMKRKKIKLSGPGLDSVFPDGDNDEATKENLERTEVHEVVQKKKSAISLKPTSRIGLASSAGGFGAISPLKRKRRPVD